MSSDAKNVCFLQKQSLEKKVFFGTKKQKNFIKKSIVLDILLNKNLEKKILFIFI
jgi:hypothetical protein